MPIVTVFGGTGFLGSRVVVHLLDAGYDVRVASRHPGRGATRGRREPRYADINDEASIDAVLDGVYGVVNAVSLYVERGGATFQSVHVDAAARLARVAQHREVQRLVLVSGLGADAASASPFIRSRGEGELAVRTEFADATIVRPSVMFGPDDALLTSIWRMLRYTPVFPMFGDGQTRLQPVHVDDVAEAIARLMGASSTTASDPSSASDATWQLGGPRIWTYEALLRAVAQHAGRKRAFMPLPFVLWDAMARVAQRLPGAPITTSQVELMRTDNVVPPGAHDLASLGISARRVEDALERLARQST